MSQAAFGATVLTAVGLVAMVALSQRRPARWPLGTLSALLSASMAAGLTAIALRTGYGGGRLFLLLCLPLLALQTIFRGNHWPARLFLTSLMVTGSVYLVAATQATLGGGLPLLGFGLSLTLLALEVLAILVSVVFAYEIAEALGRDNPEPRPPPGSAAYCPRVCVQVPACNEPPEVLRETLEALARLDYPDYAVQVVVNNTTDRSLWEPVTDACRELGPRFQFIYLPTWPGYKAGALNEATRRLPADFEVIAIVDADYVVHRDFLSVCVPYLADPRVAFVQTPQHYRDWSGKAYSRGLFHAYRYFFEVGMVTRRRVNAIIFGGTMGLIRLSALREIGGWAEWCITEDAEASLRILALGWKSIYLNRPLGDGLMPLDFAGLRRQRFRWAFGGIQILRQHGRALFGLAPSKLSFAQRYHYLASGLIWFSDAIGAGLGFFLLLTFPAVALSHPFALRQLAGPLLVMPVFMLMFGLVRFGWALKIATRASWRDVPFALLVMLSLGWTVTKACVRGLVQKQGVFLRTPKARNPLRSWTALRSTWVEFSMGVVFALGAPIVFVFGSRPLAIVVACFMLWQASAWGCAPIASLLSEGISLAPNRHALRAARKRGVRALTWSTRHLGRVAVGMAIAVGALLLVPPLVAAIERGTSSRSGIASLQVQANEAAPVPSTFGIGAIHSPRNTIRTDSNRPPLAASGPPAFATTTAPAQLPVLLTARATDPVRAQLPMLSNNPTAIRLTIPSAGTAVPLTARPRSAPSAMAPMQAEVHAY